MIKKLGQLTSHHICCDMDRTTNNSKESTCIVDNTVCMELDCDGVGAGEGSGDGGAAVLLVPYKALAIIDLNIITLQTITVPTNIKTIKCEGKLLSIG